MTNVELCKRAWDVLYGAAQKKPASFPVAVRYAALAMRRLGKSKGGDGYQLTLRIAIWDAGNICKRRGF